MSRVPNVVGWSIALLIASGGGLGCHGNLGGTSDRVVAVIPDAYQETRNRFDDEAGWQPTFSRDGRRVAYAACAGDRKCFVVLDGVKGPEFAWVGELGFSDDGKHFAHSARTSERTPTGVMVQEFVVVDGQRGAPFGQIYLEPGLAFSPDSRRFAYKVGRGAGVCVVELTPAISECQPLPDSEGLAVAWWLRRTSQEAFSSDGKRAASPVHEAGRQALQVGTWRGPWFAEVRGALFSPDGQTVAYVARDASGTFVVRGDQRGPAFMDAGSLAFSPDGRRLAYFAQTKRPPDEQRVLVVDDQPGPTFERLFWRPVFSPDSTKVAYIGWKKGSRADVLQIRNQTFRAEGGVGPPVFSPDGRKVGFPGVDGRKLLWTEVPVP